MEVQSLAPPPYVHDNVTFAEVANEVRKSGADFYEALLAFKEFWAQAEQIRLSKAQLKTLTGQGIHVLRTYAKYKQDGGDVSGVLSTFQRTFKNLTDQMISQAPVERTIQDHSLVEKLESAIAGASEDLAMQAREINDGEDAWLATHGDELPQARKNDRQRRDLLSASIRGSLPDQDISAAVAQSMKENLKIIRETTAGQKRIDAKRSLSILADLTGQPLPPSTILDREFVTIGEQAIHQGRSYDIFKGEYFTGEQIAIKVLRHLVDAETAKKSHERFARQTLNWSGLRHDTILPFYGAGVLRSSVTQNEFLLYVVSPYMKNQDVGRYLKKYGTTPAIVRLQMVRDIARGLKYMHSGPGLAKGQALVHSTLSIPNILVKDSGHVVISGFGHTKLVIDQHPANFTGDNDDYRYMAPEMLDESVFTYGSDIWSWYVLIWKRTYYDLDPTQLQGYDLFGNFDR